MLVVAMTGGIASGKSTVANRLQELGAVILDADQLSREVVRPGEPALEEIRQSFGEQVICADGTLDRQALGKIVFSDSAKRRQLESIIHPRVRERMTAELKRLQLENRTSVSVCDIPLLFETGMSLEAFDRILVVYAPRERQKRRLMERNNLSAEEAELRIQSQIPTEKKVPLADDVIDNSGELEKTLRQVDQIWNKWQRLIASRSDDESITE